MLVVEDERILAIGMKRKLESAGYTVTGIASSGEEAIANTKETSPDLVLMDIRLPDINGYEATRLIKQHKTFLKIIAQTAYASTDEKQKAIDAGCDDYISKPTKQDLLLSMIRKHLSKQKQKGPVNTL